MKDTFAAASAPLLTQQIPTLQNIEQIMQLLRAAISDHGEGDLVGGEEALLSFGHWDSFFTMTPKTSATA